MAMNTHSFGVHSFGYLCFFNSTVHLIEKKTHTHPHTKKIKCLYRAAWPNVHLPEGHGVVHPKPGSLEKEAVLQPPPVL